MIQVELRLLAAMRMCLPEADRLKGSTRLDVSEGMTCGELLDMAGVDRKRTLVVLLNGRHAGPDRKLANGDVISVFPPVAGG